MTDWYCISAQFICKGNSVDNHSTETGQNKRVGRLHITCCYCICARNSQERTKRLNRAVYSYEDDKCSKLGENEEARRTHYSLWERLWVSAFLSKSGPSPFSVAQTHVLTYFTFTCVIYSGNYSITSALEEVTADRSEQSWDEVPSGPSAATRLKLKLRLPNTFLIVGLKHGKVVFGQSGGWGIVSFDSFTW